VKDKGNMTGVCMLCWIGWF